MFTIALYNKDLGPSAAVYVQDTKSWKFVKNFNEEPVCVKTSDIGLTVATSIPSLDISHEELFELLRNIEDGIALFCDSVVANHKDAKTYAAAVPSAVAKMFQGCRTSVPCKGIAAHTVALTHGGTRYVYNPVTHLWEFQSNSPVPDGTFEEIGAQRSRYRFGCSDFLHLVTSYLNTFPITSTGNVGTVYVMAAC